MIFSLDLSIKGASRQSAGVIFASLWIAAGQSERPLRLAWSSISSFQVILWFAHEAGYS